MLAAEAHQLTAVGDIADDPVKEFSRQHIVKHFRIIIQESLEVFLEISKCCVKDVPRITIESIISRRMKEGNRLE